MIKPIIDVCRWVFKIEKKGIGKKGYAQPTRRYEENRYKGTHTYFNNTNNSNSGFQYAPVSTPATNSTWQSTQSGALNPSWNNSVGVSNSYKSNGGSMNNGNMGTNYTNTVSNGISISNAPNNMNSSIMPTNLPNTTISNGGSTNSNNGNYFIPPNNNINTAGNSFSSNNSYLNGSPQNLAQSEKVRSSALSNLIHESEKKPHPPNHPYPNNTNPINTNSLSTQSFNQNHNSFYQSSALSSLVSDNGGINSSNAQLKFKRFSDGSSNSTDFVQQTSIQNNSDLSNLQSNSTVEQGNVHQP